MFAQDLQTLLMARPFASFRIHVTDDTTRDVRHPDQVVVNRNHVTLSLGVPDQISDRWELLALAHIVRIEYPIPPAGATA